MMRKIVFFVFLIVSHIVFSSEAQRQQVMVMEIKSEIDPPMKRYVELAIDHAEKIKSDIVIIEMDTYGGVLTDAKEIVDILMRFKKPVWVFINADAASAGALISIACDSIYMSPGATIGAATVVDGTGQKAPDKYQSYMRSIMRSTAEENNRDPHIAEAMVDEDVEIDSISPAGKILTFSTAEAIKHGFCEGKVNSIEEVLAKNKIIDYEIVRFELSGVDEVIAFFMNPFLSGILILIILGGIYFELQTPGVGFPGLAALIALVLYMVPYYLTGLADNWEIIAFFIGIVLIGLEIFVVPGFGVAGIAGIIFTVGSLALIMLNNDAFNFDFVAGQDILIALIVSLSGLLGAIILLFAGGSKIADSKYFRKIALTDTQSREQGFTSSFLKESMIGKRGFTHTILRPGGKVIIEGTLYDAYTKGEYVERGKEIEVLGDETTSLRVREVSNG
ncbi:MAG TPA: NfeD family protein [Ohtaekwangia sp.]|nr:NfeD family protein [Ohtaekwangia sp.]